MIAISNVWYATSPYAALMKNNAMRILIVAAFYPPYRGGYAESVAGLAAGLVDRGHCVTVVACATDATSRDEVIDGVHVIRVPSWNPAFLHGSFPLPHPFAAWRAFHTAVRGGCDVVSTQTRFFPITFLAFTFAKLNGIRTAHTERGSCHPVSHNRFLAGIGWCIDHTAGAIVCRFSDLVVGVSDAACAFTCHLGARNPVRIPNGIDVPWWRRPDSGESDVPLRITFVGRLVHAKGVQDLLAAVAAIHGEFPTLTVSIVGDGPYRGALESLAGSLGIRDIVSFYGDLDSEGVRSFLHQAALFVNPSHSEGLPRAVLEAGAAGVPIIATDVGGTREIVPSSEFGALFPPRNISALTSVMRDALSDLSVSVRKADALTGRIASDFSIEKSAEEYERVMKMYVRDRR